MYVYTLVDNRAVDRYEDFQLFLKLEDAEIMKDSFGELKKYFDIDKVQVFE